MHKSLRFVHFFYVFMHFTNIYANAKILKNQMVVKICKKVVNLQTKFSPLSAKIILSEKTARIARKLPVSAPMVVKVFSLSDAFGSKNKAVTIRLIYTTKYTMEQELNLLLKP